MLARVHRTHYREPQQQQQQAISVDKIPGPLLVGPAASPLRAPHQVTGIKQASVRQTAAQIQAGV